jgi:hypothetical protein
VHEGPGILLRVSPVPGRAGQFVVRVFAPGDTAGRVSRFELFLGDRDIAAVSAGELASAMSADSKLVSHVTAVFAQHPFESLLLDLRAPSLYAAPWETLTGEWPFDAGWPGEPRRPVIRFSPDLADLALVPLAVPIDVVVAELVGWTGPTVETFAHPLKHFRAVIGTRLDRGRARQLLRTTAHDVVHLRASASGRGAVTAVEAGAGSVLGGEELGRVVRAGADPARLVIFETDQSSLPAMIETAYRVAGRRGPAVLVTETGAVDLTGFYYALTHDWPLTDAWLHNRLVPAGPPVRSVLLHARGGEDALRLTAAAAAMNARSGDELGRIEAALERLEPLRARPRPPRARARIEERVRRLRTAASDIRRIRETVYSYEQESRGMEPMIDAAADLQDAVGAVEGAEAEARRVINTWFERDGAAVPPSHSLEAGRRYSLNVNVGARSALSNVREPAPIPEDELEPHYEAAGLSLRVVVFSTDFEIDEPVAALVLPSPPAASKPVRFTLRAPPKARSAWARVAVYYENNLLQSLLVRAQITPAESTSDRTGNHAEVEWVLSGSLRDLKRFDRKTVNILTNESPDGTHVLAVVGSGFERQIQLGEAEIVRMIGEARKSLQWVCGDPAAKEAYNYEPDNVGDGRRFTEFVAGLAELGYDLYVDLVTGQDEQFEAELASALARPATIQVASMKSAKLVVPWSLVYDHPFVPDRRNTMCPDFLARLQSRPTADELANHRCFTSGCANRGDTNVVCPSGFWGFRHVIEQPLSTSQDGMAAGSGDVEDAIPVRGPIAMFVGYSKQLETVSDHLRELGTLPNTVPSAHSSLLEIGKALKRVDLQVVYFYCHGGHRRGKAWLGVGDKPPDLFFAANLHAWAVRWPDVRPLVFINGCNTVGITPDDLLPFNKSLARSNASGVIGSEITIPETLGREFGRRFLTGFLDGAPVGELVRELRLRLLSGYNPLGLAYTPYCLAKLRLDVT